jgi:RNA polymerase sigma factor (sigma-70 family)
MFTPASNLSPDLEWMLTSAQASEAMLREAAAREFGAALYRLAVTLSNDSQAALGAVQETLEILPANRHRYSGQVGAGSWLFSLLIQVCRRRRRASSLDLRSKRHRPSAGQQVRYQLPEGSPRETEVDRQVWRAVDALEENAKLSLLLSIIHRLPAVEIARITGRREQEVRKSLLSARLKLYRRLNNHIGRHQASETTRPGWMSRFLPVGPEHRRARRLALVRIGADAERIGPPGGIDQDLAFGEPARGEGDRGEHARLDAHLKSCPSCHAFAIEVAELEALLDRSLPARCFPFLQTIPPAETFLSRTEDRLKRRGRRKGLLAHAGQLAITGFMLALILAAGWATNRLFPDSAARALIQTLEVTRLVRVEVTATADPSPMPPPAPLPLSQWSTQEEIRQRMLQSSSLWQSAWVDATLITYGPSGYTGPPQLYRNQVWIEQPQRTMVLSGPVAADPENIVFQLYDNIYEMDLKTSLTYYYRAGEQVHQRLYGPPPAFTNLNEYNPRPLVEGTFVQSLLFPQSLAFKIRDLRVLGPETALGRLALVVDATVSEGTPERLRAAPPSDIDEGENRYLLWIDTKTGVLLRQQRFEPSYPWKLVEEVVFGGIGFEAGFPEQSYSSYFFSPERFIWENEWIPPQAGREDAPSSWKLSGVEAGPGGTTGAPLSPPSTDLDQLDFSRNRLSFRWESERSSANDTGKDSLGPFVPEKTAHLFIGGTYLGQAELGNPWYLVCERSPDGKKIIFNEGWSDPFLPVNDVRWISLSSIEEPHFLLPEGSWVGSDVAFSPDSRFLAFWGCSGSESNCGINIFNLETRKQRKLIRSENAAYFTWSPDGKYLAMIRLEYSRSDGQTIPRVTVLGVRYGEIVYQEAFDIQTKIIPEDSPTRAWGVPFPPPRTGLEGCIEPPTR